MISVDVEKLVSLGEKAMLQVHFRIFPPRPIFTGSVHTGKWTDRSRLKVYWREGGCGESEWRCCEGRGEPTQVQESDEAWNGPIR